MISLAHLKQALEPLESFGKDEHTFQIGGLSITIRPLLPVEETQVHRYAAEVIEETKDEATEDGNMSRAAALDYFDRFRIEVISHAIIQIGDLDLRREKTIATGEVLEDGTPIRVTKAAALREMIRNGFRTRLTTSFASRLTTWTSRLRGLRAVWSRSRPSVRSARRVIRRCSRIRSIRC